jgi:hypothetical protein
MSWMGLGRWNCLKESDWNENEQSETEVGIEVGVEGGFEIEDNEQQEMVEPMHFGIAFASPSESKESS